LSERLDPTISSTDESKEDEENAGRSPDDSDESSNDTIGLLLPCRYQCSLLYSIDRMGLIPARTVK
nr:hypothetical protein [Thermoproteota archaeon]